MTSRTSVGNNTLQINGLCVFVHIYLCPIFLLIGFLNFFLNESYEVSFVNRNNLAHCNIHSDAHRYQTYPNILTFIRASSTVNNFEAWLKKTSKSKNALIPSYVWVFWTERCHTRELFSHKEKKIFLLKMRNTFPEMLTQFLIEYLHCSNPIKPFSKEKL